MNEIIEIYGDTFGYILGFTAIIVSLAFAFSVYQTTITAFITSILG